MASKKSKYLFFWLPYDVKYTYETFLTGFYLSIKRFPVADAIHLGHEKIFENVPAHLPENWLQGYHTDMPTNEEINGLEKIIWGSDVFQDLESQLKSKNLVWEHILTKEYEPLMKIFETELENLKKVYKVEAIVLWSNCPSIKKIAHQHQIPVIHNEMGPLREPIYQPTCYFDFSGVNGNTEAEDRFNKFKKDDKTQHGLGRIALLSLFSNVIKPIRKFDEYELGVPLQVEDDSNIIAFSNGFNNHELIDYAKSNADKVLIRKHPYGRADYKGIPNHSESLTPQEFIHLCKRVVTINSSVGLEAILLGKTSEILGDSPFKFISDGKASKVGKLRFILLNYLIPFNYLFDKDYYDWRVTMPSEIEISEKHLNYYLKVKHGWSVTDFESEELEKKLEVIFYRNLNLQFIEKEAAYESQLLKANQEIIELKNSIASGQDKLKSVKQFENALASVRKELEEVKRSEQHYIHELNRHQDAMRSIYVSRSWRLTKPLRSFYTFKLKNGLKATLKRATVKLAVPIARRLLSNYRLRRVVIAATKKVGLYDRLKSIYLRATNPAIQPLVIVTNQNNNSRDTVINIKKIKVLKKHRGND